MVSGCRNKTSQEVKTEVWQEGIQEYCGTEAEMLCLRFPAQFCRYETFE